MRSIAAALALTLAASTALAQPAGDGADTQTVAHDHFQRGLQHFRDKEYEAAIREFGTAYELDATRGEFLFAMAQAERLSGDCASAVILYRRFLETDPAQMHAEAARESKDKCDRALASRPEGARDEVPVPESEPSSPQDDAATPPAPTPSGALVAADSPRSERTAWYRDPIATTLLGGAAVSLAVGGTFYALSASDASAARASTSYVEYVESMDRAEKRRTIAWVGVGAGGALLSSALVRWWLRDRAAAPADVAITVTTGSVGIAGSF